MATEAEDNYRAERLSQLATNPNPYPHKFTVTIEFEDFDFSPILTLLTPQWV